MDSLIYLERCTELQNVQEGLAIGPVSLDSMSEAASCFRRRRWEGIVPELSAQVEPLSEAKESELLPGLTAVDAKLPRGWRRRCGRCGSMRSLRRRICICALQVFKAVRPRPKVSDANKSQRQPLRDMREPGGLYVIECGYAQ